MDFTEVLGYNCTADRLQETPKNCYVTIGTAGCTVHTRLVQKLAFETGNIIQIYASFNYEIVLLFCT